MHLMIIWTFSCSSIKVSSDLPRIPQLTITTVNATDYLSVNTLQATEEAKTNEMAILQQHFFDLSNKLAALQATFYTIHIRRARSSSRKMPFPRQYSRSPKPIPGVYWYHHKYGTKAQRCTRPCKLTSYSYDKRGNVPARL